MPSAMVETGALKAVAKTAKAFGGFETVWLRVGGGRVSFRAMHPMGFAVVSVTVPAEGGGEGEGRALGLDGDALADVLKGAKGKMEIGWEPEGHPRAGVAWFRSGARTRSMAMAPKGGVEARQVPDIPAQASAAIDVAELRRFLDEAQSVGKGHVLAENAGGVLRLSAKGDAEGDALEWLAGPAEGAPGKVGHWLAKNWLPLLPAEHDEGAARVGLHPRALRMDWSVGGMPCAMAIAALEGLED